MKSHSSLLQIIKQIYMRDAIADGRLISVENYQCDMTLVLCPICHHAVRYYTASERACAHFRHKVNNKECHLSMINYTKEKEETIASSVVHREMSVWHYDWQHLTLLGPQCIEARNIGGDTRPRDIGDIETGEIVELQHSPISEAAFVERNASCAKAIWIFNATECELYSYEKYAQGTMFCVDTFRVCLPQEPNRVAVLFQCSDGQLYQSHCSGPIDIDCTGTLKDTRVRVLVSITPFARGILDRFFGASRWPLLHWEGAPVWKSATNLDNPIRVLSERGRDYIDACHRSYFETFPTKPLTVYQAPPGAGKSTKLIETVNRWAQIDAKRVLLVTFNKENQSILEACIDKNCEARTLDSLCYEACERPKSLLAKWSDLQLVDKFFKNSNKWNKITKFGGKRASRIVDFQLRHPYKGVAKVCRFHSQLTRKGWDVNTNSFPIRNIVHQKMTFSALRYICDKCCLLSKLLDQFDVIVVDERQDLMSAQELRLLCQGSKPVVMIGDELQEINSFCDDPPCDKCEFESEQRPTLPPSIEWYSSWRLDQQTVRFLEYRFGCRMHSFRPNTEEVSIHWQEELQAPENTLVLCRGNKGVVEVACQFPDFYVIGGSDLATRLEDASKDKTMVTPMAQYAQQLKRTGALENVCVLLRNRTVNLKDVKGSAVCTVHKAKGFEYDHCAIYKDLLEEVSGDDNIEQHIRFVAFTRHKKSLTIMCKIQSKQTQEELEKQCQFNVKQQKQELPKKRPKWQQRWFGAYHEQARWLCTREYNELNQTSLPLHKYLQNYNLELKL